MRIRLTLVAVLVLVAGMSQGSRPAISGRVLLWGSTNGLQGGALLQKEAGSAGRYVPLGILSEIAVHAGMEVGDWKKVDRWVRDNLEEECAIAYESSGRRAYEPYFMLAPQGGAHDLRSLEHVVKESIVPRRGDASTLDLQSIGLDMARAAVVEAALRSARGPTAVEEIAAASLGHPVVRSHFVEQGAWLQLPRFEAEVDLKYNLATTVGGVVALIRMLGSEAGLRDRLPWQETRFEMDGRPVKVVELQEVIRGSYWLVQIGRGDVLALLETKPTYKPSMGELELLESIGGGSSVLRATRGDWGIGAGVTRNGAPRPEFPKVSGKAHYGGRILEFAAEDGVIALDGEAVPARVYASGGDIVITVEDAEHAERVPWRVHVRNGEPYMLRRSTFGDGWSATVPIRVESIR